MTKHLDTILFDLDGTLLPLEQNAFVETYFSLLAKRAAALGYDDTRFFLKALWQGTRAMLHNNGSMLNSERFWTDFSRSLGEGVQALENEFYDFYATDFNQTRAILDRQYDTRALLGGLRAKGYAIALATNPLFPLVAVESRLGWIGLKPADFDHITTYDNSRYCKPNPGYFRDLLATLGKEPGQCMMIGNSPGDDMAAAELGMPVFLLTDHLENADSLPTGAYPQGDFAALTSFLASLPAVG